MKNNEQVKKITVNASKRYEVIIGKGLIGCAGEYLAEVIKPCKIALVTDDTVDVLYADCVVKSLEDSGFIVVKYVFSHGEESKNLSVYGEILDFLAENELTRTDALVALGGGVVGDMAGFAAATYLRGIKYVQIPTTLLSQIDSSVGGKTAIDLKKGKNLVGAFCQPILVLCDTKTLDSLPKKIFVDGLGEVAKYAVLDKDIFTLVEKDGYAIEDLVYACVDYKRKIVEADEFEGGVRKLLNFGHTPAHGIENLSGYTIPHGNAVAMGVEIIMKNSLRHGYISEEEYKKVSAVVKKLVGENECPFAIEEVMQAALSDKKRSGNYITLMMAFGIGKVEGRKIDIFDLKEYIK